jgi:hypothetical protein
MGFPYSERVISDLSVSLIYAHRKILLPGHLFIAIDGIGQIVDMAV